MDSPTPRKSLATITNNCWRRLSGPSPYCTNESIPHFSSLDRQDSFRRNYPFLAELGSSVDILNEIPQRAIIFGKRNGFLFSLHEGGEPFGDGDFFEGRFLDGVLEFGGMGRFAEQSRFPVREGIFQSPEAACPVGIEDIAVPFMSLPYGRKDGAVVDRGTAYE